MIVITLIAITRVEADPITLESLLDEMVNRENIARYPDPEFRLRQFSSYNRASVSPDQPGWFANRDQEDYFLRVEENGGRKEWVVFEDLTPGVLVRLWMPDRRKLPRGTPEPETAILRVYLDGKKTPVIEGPALDLFNGSSSYFPFPFAHGSLSSAVSFFPIPYAKQCKITLDAQPFFYAFTYRDYPEGTSVESFSLQNWQALRTKISQVGGKLEQPIEGVSGYSKPEPIVLSPGDEYSQSLPTGSHAVRGLRLKLDKNAPPEFTRSLILIMEFDGKETVWCPVGDFFGSGTGLNPFEGWYRSVRADGTMACEWVMPYRETARLTLMNLSESVIPFEVSLVVGDWVWDDRSMYFNSRWNYEYPIHTRPQRDWNYVTLRGKGVFVGDTLTVYNPISFYWWGEGDEKIWFDDELFPAIFGTGTEDYYNYSWGGPNTGFYEHPFHAQVRANRFNKLHPRPEGDLKDTQGFNTETRTRSLDTMPFGTHMQLDMEIWHTRECDVGYMVSNYWYGFADTISNLAPELEDAAAAIVGREFLDLENWPEAPEKTD